LLLQANPIGIKPRGGSRGETDRTAVLLVKEREEKGNGKTSWEKSPPPNSKNRKWKLEKKINGEKIGD
jgi:hypothetical protein